jgi:hypothetical protein
MRTRLGFVVRPAVAVLVALFAVCSSGGAARADEGMWTFDNFPSAKVGGTYGFTPSQAWLDHVRLSSVRLAFGCSGSFVSASGLVMTNHHCAQGCISQLSTGGKDYNRDGFYAASTAEEQRCPAQEIDQLLKIADVTAQIHAAEKGLTASAANAARKAQIARITQACDPLLRCDVVTLYNGGQYKLYTYRAFRDVRLVWAPEFDIAFFGGDPDNFSYPRFDLDITLLRVYDGDKPALTPDFFAWNPAGPQDGELTFVSGNPGRTERLDTVAELQYARDAALPLAIRTSSDLDGYLTRYAAESPEHAKDALDAIFGTENGLKLQIGREAALLTPSFFAGKEKQEAAFRAAVAAKPELQAKYGGAWAAIARTEKLRDDRTAYLDGSALARGSTLLGIAQTLVRAAAERPKPNAQRLPEFSDARLRTLQLQLFSTAPISTDFERARLTWTFTKFRQNLTADDPFVREVLGQRSPEELAALIATSKLTDPAYRKTLWDGGQAAIDASTDPAIVLMRAIDPQTRAVRKTFEDTIEAPIAANEELLGEARFAVYGTSVYPDATFTARLSYGSVKGYEQRGTFVPPFTTFAGLYERATGRAPFALPKSWLDAKSALDLNTKMNFVTTNDIIGGNSGSPVIDKDARIIGLVFDGNLQSLGGDYFYDGTANRAVAVDSAAITAALRVVYKDKRLLEELGQ